MHLQKQKSPPAGFPSGEWALPLNLGLKLYVTSLHAPEDGCGLQQMQAPIEPSFFWRRELTLISSFSALRHFDYIGGRGWSQAENLVDQLNPPIAQIPAVNLRNLRDLWMGAGHYVPRAYGRMATQSPRDKMSRSGIKPHQPPSVGYP